MKKIIFCFFVFFINISAVQKLYYLQYPQKINQNILSKDELETIAFVRKAIDKSESFISKIPESMFFFGGTMTSPRTRHLLNNICSFLNTRYLEIGTHKGASLICALYKNPITYAYGIDNWSEFGGPKVEFYANLKKYIPNYPCTHLTADAFQVDVSKLPKFNIYFYDGGHATIDQERAFTHYNSCFDDVFIAIVDDWMWDQVRVGTFNAFDKLGYTLLFEKEVALRYKDDIPWRFLYVCIVKK